MSRFMEHLPKIAVIGFLIGGAAIAISKAGGNAPKPVAVDIVTPPLSVQASAGAKAFGETCAACHGETGGGSDQGPPLIHDIYNPGHHGDDAFYRAVNTGTKQHHWAFGNMPPQSHVAQQDIANIITFVREVQWANGIFYRQHTM